MSNLDLLLPLWGFIVVMVATPGPANLLLMSAGAQQGFLRTLPFIGGLVVGKLLLNLALALGLAQLLPEGSGLRVVFVLLSATYMAYLALRNWTPSATASQPSRFSFLAGTIVHPLSPKTWVMATLALSSFADGFDSPGERLLVVPLSFLIAQVFFPLPLVPGGSGAKPGFSAEPGTAPGPDCADAGGDPVGGTALATADPDMPYLRLGQFEQHLLFVGMQGVHASGLYLVGPIRVGNQRTAHSRQVKIAPLQSLQQPINTGNTAATEKTPHRAPE